MFLYQLQGINLETPIEGYLQIQFNILEDKGEQYDHFSSFKYLGADS